MSSSVCQGLQSCLEPRFVEPLVLRLRLAPPEPDSSWLLGPTQKPPRLAEPEARVTHNKIVAATAAPDPTTAKTAINRQNPDPTTEGWSFLESASDSMKPVSGGDHDGVYVQPLMKHSHSMPLGEKISLEMCTESLGSETGSSNISGLDDIAISSTAPGVKNPPPRSFLGTKRLSRRGSLSFPPPLTSISGSAGVHMRPHREGGRLVLEAVTVSSPQKSFHVERSEGRLRLRLWEDDSDRNFNTRGADEETTGEEQGEDGGNCENVGVEIGSYETLGNGRPCRFREEGGPSDKGLLRLEPFVVAT